MSSKNISAARYDSFSISLFSIIFIFAIQTLERAWNQAIKIMVTIKIPTRISMSVKALWERYFLFWDNMNYFLKNKYWRKSPGALKRVYKENGFLKKYWFHERVKKSKIANTWECLWFLFQSLVFQNKNMPKDRKTLKNILKIYNTNEKNMFSKSIFSCRFFTAQYDFTKIYIKYSI